MRTEVKEVKGLVTKSDTYLPCPALVVVRYTSDELGKTLSLQSGDTMISIPFKEIEEMTRL